VNVLSSLALALAGGSVLVSFAQQAQPGRTDRQQGPPLVVSTTDIQSAKFPVIEMHGHLGSNNLMPANLERIVRDMDALNIRILVNASGGSGDRLKQNVEKLGKYPGRFLVFANLDFANIDDPEWSKKAVSQLRVDVANGARGLKVFRNPGLDLKDAKGQRVKLDDPRFDPIWAECGRAKLPVILQSGNGLAFPSRDNERNSTGPSPERNTNLEAALAEQYHVFDRYPGTTFIHGDLGTLGNNLGELAKLMDRFPNLYVEFGNGLSELGRQPRAARQWLIKYQNRVLFGKLIFLKDELLSSFRVLESPDESFFLNRRTSWPVYGIDLPDFVLKKIYYQNALRVMPALAGGFTK